MGITAAYVLGGCTSSTAPSSTASDKSTCEAIQSSFYYPTIPTTGETVPLSSATRIAGLLNRAHNARLRGLAPELEQAIRTDNKRSIVQVFNELSQTVCPEVTGVPPAT
jgi:hypothetical protein